MKDVVRRWLRPVPATVWVLWGLQTVFVVRLLSERKTVVESLPIFFLGIAMTGFALWAYGWLAVLTTPRQRAAALAWNGAAVVFYAALLMYHWHSKAQFDWGVMWRFRSELLGPEVRGMVGSLLGWRTYAFLGIALAGILLFEAAGEFVSKPDRPRWRWSAAGLAGAVAAVLTLGPVPARDEFTASLRSIRGSLLLERLMPKTVGGGAYPYVRRPIPAGRSVAPARRPHVFIVLIESFNANFVEARTGDGREYTPFFNSLIPKGVYVEGFHGNSMESSRGQLSLLCSLWPSLRGQVFDVYRGLRLHCLPEMLRKQGYTTVFDQATRYLKFEETGPFMSANGFDVVRAAMDREAPHRDPGKVWGWGLQDDVFFEEFFAYLDAKRGLEAAGGAEPRFFAMLCTISSHFPDNEIPAAQKFLFPNASGGKAGYANSIYLADTYLRTFFRELEARDDLKDSIVIVTGDHSYPTGEHGNVSSQVGFYEELFRTPLLILWPGVLEPRRLRRELWSQIDVAPTILDMLGIEVPNHFLGRSILRGFDPGRDRVHLIQPDDGGFIGVIAENDLKYVLGIARDEEFVFDLRRDPREERNLIDQYRNTKELEQFRHEVGRVLLNQKLTEENRIWPPEGVAP